MTVIDTLDTIAPDEVQTLADVGVQIRSDESQVRSGTYVLRDHLPLCVQTYREGLGMLPIAEALRRYDWLREGYYWRLVRTEQDDVTRQVAAEAEPQGYFIWVRQGTRITRPAQVGLFIAHDGLSQKLHNVVLLEDDTELHLITGCTTGRAVRSGHHLAVNEAWVGKNSTLTFTMVHSWGPEVIVRPRAAVAVDDHSRYINNYVSLRPALDIQSNPRTYLNGVGATAKYMTVILGSRGSTIDTGGEVYMNGEDSGAEMVHRGVCTGGKMYQRGFLVGKARCRAHVDCAGMLLDPGDDGFIESVPGLRSFHVEAQMSHEASVGKVAPEQVEYLMSRGMEEREAISMIIRGFLDADIEGLGAELDARIGEIASLAGHGEQRQST
jgi:Fe-S cluster assembly scaffold protein SufB